MSILVTSHPGDPLARSLLELLPAEDGPLTLVCPDGTGCEPMRREVVRLRADLRDPETMRHLLSTLCPRAVVHLAVPDSVAETERLPARALQNGLLPVMHLLEAVRAVAPEARVIVRSTAEVYGLPPHGRGPDDLRLESDPLQPVTLLGAVHAGIEALVLRYARQHRINAGLVRTFGIIGPGLPPVFFTPSVAQQLARIVQNRGEPLVLTGDLEGTRDFLDARDGARALALLLERGVGGIWNLCSGRATTLREVATELQRLAGLDVNWRLDPSRERSDDLPMLVGNPARLIEATGWAPVFTLRQSLTDVWREALTMAARSRRPETP